MSQRDPVQTIWGINRADRNLFITMTVASGTALASTFAALAITQRPPEQTEAQTLFLLIVGTPASFTATGTVSWAILNAKEVIMSIADSIRERTAKRRKAVRDEGRQEGRDEAMQEILAALESGQGQKAVEQLIRKNLEGQGNGG